LLINLGQVVTLHLDILALAHLLTGDERESLKHLLLGGVIFRQLLELA
jgi:hypothetical protein